MAGMGDGYVGTAQDAARIRRLQKQRDQERQKILDLKKKSSEGQVGLVQFGQATSEVSKLFFPFLPPWDPLSQLDAMPREYKRDGRVLSRLNRFCSPDFLMERGSVV